MPPPPPGPLVYSTLRPLSEGEKKKERRKNGEDDAGDSSLPYQAVTSKDDSAAMSSYDEAVNKYNQRSSANRGRHGRPTRRSALINPLYIGVPIAGACVLLAMIIFAIYILRRSAPFSQRAYHYPANMARQPCPPPGGAKSTVARTQIYIGCDRSPSGSEAKLLVKA